MILDLLMGAIWLFGLFLLYLLFAELPWLIQSVQADPPTLAATIWRKAKSNIVWPWKVWRHYREAHKK